MAAYVIGDIEITDPAVFQEYQRLAPPLIAKYGGKYLVRGGEMEKIEGEWNLKRMVVLEFESVERAKEFYDSEDYEPVKQIRLRSSNSNVVIVEGV